MTTESSAPNTNARDLTHLRIPWPGLSIGLAIVALVSLGTLATIVSVKDVDILSTVALALAILSFAAQLVVSLLQTESSAKLNASTESALAEMRATTESLLTNQRDQFDRVLGAALKAIPVAVDDVAATSENGDDGDSNSSDDVSADALKQSLSIRMRELLNAGPLTTNYATRRDELQPSNLDKHPTEEEGTVALQALRRLEPLALPALVDVAQKIRLAERHGRSPKARFRSESGEPGPSFKVLLAAGLVERETEQSESGTTSYYSLTDLGRTVARLLLPKTPKPQWLRDALGTGE